MTWPVPQNSWTPERIETLTKLWAAGYSGSQIAKQLGNITRNAVIGKIHRLGLPKRAQETLRETERVSRAMNRKERRLPTRAVIVNNAVMEAPEPRAPRVMIPLNAFDALPDTNPRPWLERGRGCNWPIGDGLSCCEPVHAAGWCVTHHAVGRVAPKTDAKQLARMLRRHVA